jgi:hypothetical protein
MENIGQITTTFTCQYYINKKRIIIRSTSEHINDFLAVIGGEYSKILDGYLLHTDKTFVDIIGMHNHVIKSIENLYQQYNKEHGSEKVQLVKEQVCVANANESAPGSVNVENAKKKQSNIGASNSNSSSYETIEDSVSIDNTTINGYLISINNLDWVLYFSEDLDESAMLKSKLFRGCKIKYSKIYQGYSFCNEKNFVEKLEKNGYFPVNGIFYSKDNSCFLFLSNHLDADARKLEIQKIKKLSGKYNKKTNIYVIPMKYSENLVSLGYIFVC